MGPSTCSRTRDKQACLDRSGAAEGRAAGGSPSSGQSIPATLLDLGDAHGLIYQLLQDSQSRAAFRQCCKTTYRSPSINAHLKALDFGSIEWTAQPLRKKKGSRQGKRGSDEYAPKAIMSVIASFPKHATLKQLRLLSNHSNARINFREFLTHAEALDSVSEAARKRLCTVKAVNTEADSVDVAAAEKLTAIFPQLEDLRLHCLQYSNDFFGTLASRHCDIQALELFECKSSEGPVNATEGIAKLTSLRTLKLGSIAHGSQLHPLTSLQSLRHLSVSNFQPVGLGHVVSAVPLLTLDLDILDSHFPRLPPSEHLASSTLTTLGIRGDLSHLSDRMSMLDFPCLKKLHFNRTIFLWVNEPLENEEVLERVGRVAGWLGQRCLTWTGKVDNFHLNCNNSSQPYKSASFCATLFKRLFPMTHQLGFICRLSLSYIKLSHASLRDMATLFPHVSHLTLAQLGLCSPLELPDLLAYLPFLNCMEVYGVMYTNTGENGVKVAMSQDLHALLCAARDRCRELSLHVWDHEIWSNLEAAWEAEASKHPLCTHVRLLRH